MLLNFSADGVRRIGGKLAAGHDDENDTSRLDAACGGHWWREEFLAALSGGDQAAGHVARAYQQRTERLAGARSWLVPVHRRPDHQPVYYLLFFTRHPDGMRSSATPCPPPRRHGVALGRWPTGRLAPAGRSKPARRRSSRFEELADDEQVEAALEAEWEKIIYGNLRDLLVAVSVSPLSPSVSRPSTARHLGFARSKHVRRAIAGCTPRA